MQEQDQADRLQLYSDQELPRRMKNGTTLIELTAKRGPALFDRARMCLSCKNRERGLPKHKYAIGQLPP